MGRASANLRARSGERFSLSDPSRPRYDLPGGCWKVYVILQDFLAPSDTGRGPLQCDWIDPESLRPLSQAHRAAFVRGARHEEAASRPSRLTEGLQAFLIRNEGRIAVVVNEWFFAIQGQIRSFTGSGGTTEWGLFYVGGRPTYGLAFYRLTAIRPSKASTLYALHIVPSDSPMEEWWTSGED